LTTPSRDPTATSFRPRLRAHLRLEQDRLDDRLLDRSVHLKDAAAALAPLLDGATEWLDIRSTLVELGHAPEAVDNALRRLLFLHAIEGAGDATVAKLERLLRGEETVPTSILEGARFGCQGSGACCQGYAFGPLTDADVATLDALDLAAVFPNVEPPYVETDEGGRYLRRDGDRRCVFLNGERRCGLHAAFGSDAKPGFCRLFPLDSFGTIEGIRVVDRGTCASFAVSARVGLPLVDDLPRVRPLLPPPVLHHPLVLVGEWAWDYAVMLRFTTAATTLVKRNLGTASETLMAIGRCLDALMEATAQCPLEPGQPDAVVSAVLASDATSWYRPADSDAAIAGTHAMSDLLRALGVAFTEAIDGGDTHPLAARDLAALLEHTATAITADVLPATAPAANAGVDEALRISMRQQLFGRQFLVGGHANAGLVRIAVIQLLALAGARIEAGARALTAADLNRGHVLATRAFESGKVDAVLVAHEPRWRVLLDGLARAAQRTIVVH
jgi:Fe-S-cluster containining protein